ncbi:MAG: DUF433 domain-containing protein [Verrucomicrobiales bacterium]|nr:DUF433 domain-containing protein [Verrucomicrobiales bacterium]HQW28152.1 DUF433 domain-containing protein [Verrucomicrobiales bacterium]
MDSRIEINPEICNGRPIIAGTRITVETVLSYLSAGDPVEEIMIAHPVLTRADILSCIDYARRLSAARSTVSLSS